jgi:hypothetical protein
MWPWLFKRTFLKCGVGRREYDVLRNPTTYLKRSKLMRFIDKQPDAWRDPKRIINEFYHEELIIFSGQQC